MKEYSKPFDSTIATHIKCKRHFMEEVLHVASPLFVKASEQGVHPENIAELFLSIQPTWGVLSERFRAAFPHQEAKVAPAEKQRVNNVLFESKSLYFAADTLTEPARYFLYLGFVALRSMEKEFPFLLEKHKVFDEELSKSLSGSSYSPPSFSVTKR